MMTKWAENEEQENDCISKRNDDNNGNKRSNENRGKGPRDQSDQGRKRRLDNHVAALDRPSVEKNYPRKSNSKSSYSKGVHSTPSSIKRCNPLSDALHQNSGVVLNGQGSGRHPPKGASYHDLGTMKCEHGSQS